MSAVRHFGLRWVLPVIASGVAWAILTVGLGLSSTTAVLGGFVLGGLVSAVTLLGAITSWGAKPTPPCSRRP